MNNTQKRLSAEAWSMLKGLSQLRKSARKELDFLHSLPSGMSSEKLEDLVSSIDHFSGEISDFLANMKEATDNDALEREFDDISRRYISLTWLADNLLGK